LQAELGEKRANALVGRALGAIYRRYGEEFWRAKNEEDLGKVMGSELAAFARDDALDYTVIEESRDAFAFDVTACRYAEFYKQLGEPELGFLLVCSGDFLRSLRDLVPTLNSRARRPLCKVQVTATFDTTDRGLWRRNRTGPERRRLEYQRERPPF
jgi:hypothetical protein